MEDRVVMKDKYAKIQSLVSGGKEMEKREKRKGLRAKDVNLHLGELPMESERGIQTFGNASEVTKRKKNKSHQSDEETQSLARVGKNKKERKKKNGHRSRDVTFHLDERLMESEAEMKTFGNASEVTKRKKNKVHQANGLEHHQDEPHVELEAESVETQPLASKEKKRKKLKVHGTKDVNCNTDELSTESPKEDNSRCANESHTMLTDKKRSKGTKISQTKASIVPSEGIRKESLAENKEAGQGEHDQIQTNPRKRKKNRNAEVKDQAFFLEEAPSNKKRKISKPKKKTGGNDDIIPPGSTEGKDPNITEKSRNTKKKKRVSEDPNITEKSRNTKKKKRVSFSDHVESFSSDAFSHLESQYTKEQMMGKRFSKEEDELVIQAVNSFLKARNIDKKRGYEMLLDTRKHKEFRYAWQEIATSIPWRDHVAVSYRARTLMSRSKRPWTPEEIVTVLRYQKEHGNKWKALAEELQRSRIHVKDLWRRNRLPNAKRGHWSQDEYQQFFDLVNLDLQMKAFEEKNHKHGLIRENIAWTAISDKMTSKYDTVLCLKWYNSLASPMVAQGLWSDCDDYRLVDALLQLDACCKEDVDWNNLVKNRSAEICLKRWNEMTKHIGGYKEKTFMEQVELLSTRYCRGMEKYRPESAHE